MDRDKFPQNIVEISVPGVSSGYSINSGCVVSKCNITFIRIVRMQFWRQAFLIV